MRFPVSAVALSALLMAACGPAVQPPTTAGPVPDGATSSGVDAAASLITAASVGGHVEYLASDRMRGRDTPSPELDLAAAYLADRFREYGLTPMGDDGGFIQRWPHEDSRLDVAAMRFEARSQDATMSLRYATDYFVLPSRTDSVVADAVFAGAARPGASLPADARGRFVVMFVADTASQAWQQNLSAGLQAAFQVGAAGVVAIVDPDFDPQLIGRIAGEVQGQVAPFPVFGVAYEAGRDMVRQGGLDLDAVRNRSDGSVTPLDGVRIAVSTPITTGTVMVPNVVAVLPGSDPARRDEYVVYSAHFDHVGVGQPDAAGDSIYNGADDNASGTTAVLEAARAFAALDQAPARSVMFVMVSGEEKGLLGSRWFVENPPVPVTQMVANINADMVGRNAPDSVVAIGQEYSDLGETVQRVARRHPGLGLTVAPDQWPEEQLFFRSDQFNFLAKEIPALFFTTGLHDQYHEPSDEAHLIDSDKLARIARLVFHLGHEIATAPERPRWTPDGLAEVRRLTGRN
ncbi:MAG TPA: M20/M25/M40 family metallo-hydrolase [Longimicrobiales bacterium]|nr:M20/M25/M40 family metallo-hydrolase [Longimicrobiales bacterium]